MTEQNNKKTSHRVPFYRRPIFLVGVAVVVIAIIAVIIIAITKPSSSNTTTEQDSSSTSFDSPTKPTTSPDTSGESEDEPSEPEGVLQYEGQDPNKLHELTGSVTLRSVNYDAGTLTIAASIDQFLQSDGECALRLLSGDQEAYSGTLPAAADITTSVCGPFSAPLSQLNSGTYKIEITVTADGKTGVITDELQI